MNIKKSMWYRRCKYIESQWNLLWYNTIHRCNLSIHRVLLPISCAVLFELFRHFFYLIIFFQIKFKRYTSRSLNYMRCLFLILCTSLPIKLPLSFSSLFSDTCSSVNTTFNWTLLTWTDRISPLSLLSRCSSVSITLNIRL